MSHAPRSFAELLRTDRRYRIDAYAFVFEALRHAQQSLNMGRACKSEPVEGEEPAEAKQEPGEGAGEERHVTGQELCEAIRLYSLEQYGFMSKTVLNSWGIKSTGDFGEIVFNLIRIGKMRKTSSDRREDFDNVYDFDKAFCDEFTIAKPDRRE